MDNRRYKYFMVEDIIGNGNHFKTALRFSSNYSIERIKSEIDRGAAITEISEEQYYEFHTRETV